MLKGADFFRGSTAEPLRPNDDSVTLYLQHVEKLIQMVGVGNYTYLTLSYNGFIEIVRFDCIQSHDEMLQPNTIMITRDVTGTGRKTFPKGACIRFDWTEPALIDLIKQNQG